MEQTRNGETFPREKKKKRQSYNSSQPHLNFDVREQGHPDVGEDVHADRQEYKNVEKYSRGVGAGRQDLIEARDVRRESNDADHSKRSNQSEKSDVVTVFVWMHAGNTTAGKIHDEHAHAAPVSIRVLGWGGVGEGEVFGKREKKPKRTETSMSTLVHLDH